VRTTAAVDVCLATGGDDLSYEHAEYLFKRRSRRISRDGLPCISSGTWP